MSGKVTVSVVMPVFNEEAHIERSVAIALDQHLDSRLEVLAVDGGSDDRTPEILDRLAREDDRLRVLSNPERQIPNALNVGLRHARGRYVVRMDAHTRYPSDYVATGIRRLEAGGVECVGGPQLPYGEDKWSRRVALALRTRVGIGGASFRNATDEIEVDTTFTGIWRRRTLLEHGGWDERWPINEDGELAARIREAGGRYVCVPAMAANYVPRNSIPALARQYWRYGQYRAKTARHHPTALRRSHIFPPVLVLVAILTLAGGRGGRLARRALLLYACALGAGTVEASRDGDRTPRDLASVPVVFAVMHLTWGAGFLVGCTRFGLPVAALARVLGLRRAR